MNYCTFKGDYGCSKELNGKCLSSGYCRFQAKSKQQQIFQHFGLSNQIDKLFEEYREVLIAFLYGTENDIKEELADVKNLIEQLTDYYGRKEIEKIQEFKNERTLERIESGYYG